MTKARARVKIYENENQDQEMAFKMEKHEQDKIIYDQETTKHSEINQHGDWKNRIQNVYRSLPQGNYDQKLQRGFRQAPWTNLVEVAIANLEKAVEDNKMGKMLCELVKQQSAPAVDIEEFDGNPLQYSYFRLMFQEVVEKKFASPQRRLTQLIKVTTGEIRELVKPYIHNNRTYGYKNAMKLVEIK